MDIETFAHIVARDEAPLNGIASMIDFVVEDYADRLDDDGREQLRLIQQMASRGVRMVDGLRRFSAWRRRPASRGASIWRPSPNARSPAARRWRPRPPCAPTSARCRRCWAIPRSYPICSTSSPATRCASTTDRSATSPSRHSTPRRPTCPPGHVAIAITDTGIGIAPKFQDAVFDMFKRLHAPDTFGGGVGAGLAVARAIVERHGGRASGSPAAALPAPPWLSPCRPLRPRSDR